MKTTKNLLLTLLLICSKIGFTQADGINEKPTAEINFKTHRIGLILGSTSATGDFGSTAANKEEAGFAKGGVHIGLTYSYSIDENIALFFNYEGFGYVVDAQTYAIALNNQLVSQGINPERTEVEIDPYGVGLFRVGPKFQFKEKNVLFFIKPSIGFASMIVPELRARATANGNTATVTQREYSTDVETAYGISGGIEVQASELVGVALNIGYVTSNDFEVVAIIDDGKQLSTARYSQPYSAINIGINLGFNF